MDSSQARRVIAAGMIGNVLEWYDFAIYGYFATAIGRQFFPHEDAVAQLLSAFGVFALGYVMRPVGGVLIGHIGDRFGRRGAHVLGYRHGDPHIPDRTAPGIRDARPRGPDRAHALAHGPGSLGRRGIYELDGVPGRARPGGPPSRHGALASCGATGGILLGSAVGASFAASMSEAALDASGWRIPFLIGLLVGIAGYLLRRHMLETTPTDRPQACPDHRDAPRSLGHRASVRRSLRV